MSKTGLGQDVKRGVKENDEGKAIYDTAARIRGIVVSCLVSLRSCVDFI